MRKEGGRGEKGRGKGNETDRVRSSGRGKEKGERSR